jgi:hypothetical protein
VGQLKIITLLAVMAMLLVDLFGSKSSVGGPITDLLVVFIVMLAVGIYEAWSRKRGALGWIVNIVAAVIGGFVAVSLAGMAMETILTQIRFQGRLATSHHPMRYIAEVGMAIFTVLGSWLTLQIVNRFRLMSAR